MPASWLRRASTSFLDAADARADAAWAIDCLMLSTVAESTADASGRFLGLVAARSWAPS